jgi:hypothetical protein
MRFRPRTISSNVRISTRVLGRPKHPQNVSQVSIKSITEAKEGSQRRAISPALDEGNRLNAHPRPLGQEVLGELQFFPPAPEASCHRQA